MDGSNWKLDQMEKMMASIHQVLLKLEVEELKLGVALEVGGEVESLKKP